MATSRKYSVFRPMKVQVRPGSVAEKLNRGHAMLPGGARQTRAIAPGIRRSPRDDLIFHGGKTVPKMRFANFFVGGAAAWRPSDIDAIDQGIFRAMNDRRLNNVIVQYFPGEKLECDRREAKVLPGSPPSKVSQGDVELFIKKLYADGTIGRRDLDVTIFNLLLPSGTLLTDAAAATGNLAGHGKSATGRIGKASTSLGGLGGYHGSVRFKSAGVNVRVYYSVDVYSEFLENGRENGIAAFSTPWKNVVATLYHEMNEFRTDPDVDDSIAAGDDPHGSDFLGWVSKQGDEIGDQPIAAADPLDEVFKQVKLTGKSTYIPVQFQYSNFVHGAEGPIRKPHA